jgi:hypothetical protein
VWGEVVVLEGGVEKPRVAMEAETLTKAMAVGHAKEKMPAGMRVLPMEPLVKSMATAEREFTTGDGWRRRQHHHQEPNEQSPTMSRHDPSPRTQ